MGSSPNPSDSRFSNAGPLRPSVRPIPDNAGKTVPGIPGNHASRCRPQRPWAVTRKHRSLPRAEGNRGTERPEVPRTTNRHDQPLPRAVSKGFADLGSVPATPKSAPIVRIAAKCFRKSKPRDHRHRPERQDVGPRCGPRSWFPNGPSPESQSNVVHQ